MTRGRDGARWGRSAAAGLAWLAVAASAPLASPPAPSSAPPDLARGEAPGDAAPVVLGTCDGQDWSVSKTVRPLPDAGLFTMDGQSRRDVVAHRGFTLTWAELNPAPGVYDWAPVEKLLSRAERGDYGVVLRLKSSVVARRSPFGPLDAVPDWVMAPPSPPVARTRDRGPDEWIDVVVPWDERVQSAYLEFVRAFGQARLHRHRRLLGLYVHGISTSWGEELWLDEGAVAALRPYGLSPERLRATFEARIAAWADAFGDDAGKLAWVGTGWIAAGDAWRDYARMGDALDAFAQARGLGRRWGHSEAYDGLLDQGGQVLEDDGRLRTDPASPILAERRYWGGENEVWKGRASEAFDYRRATVRALQMEMRLLWVNDAGVGLDPVITRYFTQVAGRRPADAPDAWSVLRETEVRVGNDHRRVGNLERWLYMRGAPDDGAPARARPVERARQSKDAGPAREWTARSVAAADGGRIGFDLDERFLAGAEDADLIVQVSWIDDGARWHLDASRARGRTTAPPVSGRGDGRERTTHVRVAGFAPSAEAPDLEVVADDGRLAVSRVRVVRVDAAGPSCVEGGGAGGAHG